MQALNSSRVPSSRRLCLSPRTRMMAVLITAFGLAWAWPGAAPVAQPGPVATPLDAALVCRIMPAPAPGGDGQSWSQSMRLHDALADPDCTELWVAAGVYRPGTQVTDSFLIPPGTALYGGFAGDETQRSARDPQAHVTILSGDIGQDDVHSGAPGITADADDIRGSNSQHVVRIASTEAAPMGWQTPITLDGFTITGGDARGVGNGGGLVLQVEAGLMNTNSLNLYQLVFRGNAAINGGAIGRAADTDATRRVALGGWDLRFQGNLAQGLAGADGGGEDGGEALGGAIYAISGLFRNLGFIDNRALGGDGGQGGAGTSGGAGGAGRGGAAYLMEAPGLFNVTAYGNRAIGGAGGSSVAPALAGGQGGDASGGAFHIDDGLDLTFATVVGNAAVPGAAGADAAPISAGVAGSAAVAVPGPRTQAPHTPAAAPGQARGGALYSETNSSYKTNLQGVIFWGNQAGEGSEIFNQGRFGNPPSPPQIAYSIIQGAGDSGSGWDADVGVDGGNNLDRDPLLAAPAENGGLSPTLMPTPDSPAVDSAPWLCSPITPGACFEVDQRGVPRPQGSAFDRGAVELRPDQRPVCYVDAAASGNNDGSSWADAWTDLQDALGAGICSETWVAQGTYRPTTGNDPMASFRIRPLTRLYGGFAGGESERQMRDPKVHPTFLSGDIGVPGDIADNSYNVVVLDAVGAFGPIHNDTVIDGFVVTGGNARGGSNGAGTMGGGLFCRGECSPSLAQLVFEDNHALGGGAIGLQILNGEVDLRVRDVVFRNNYSRMYGGAVYLSAQRDGDTEPVSGGIHFERVLFDGNGIDDPLMPGQSFGGGMMLQFADPGTVLEVQFANTTWHANQADYGSALMLATGNDGVLDARIGHATFSGNDSAVGDAVVYFVSETSGSSLQFERVIAWDNGDDELVASMDLPDVVVPEIGIDGGLLQGGCPAVATCTAVQDIDPQLGALQDHGGFVPGLMPAAGSPAIDAGSCALAEDQRGIERPQGPACDAGALELREAQLTVQVSTPGGSVSGAATPVPNGAAISACRQGSGTCSAWYGIEPSAPTVALDFAPDAGWHLGSSSGCGTPLLADCTVSVAFARNQHHVGGSLDGLSGGSLTLQLNGGNDLVLSANGSFQFANALDYEATYIVTVASQPDDPSQTCTLTNASGSLPDADVTNVEVHCSANEHLVSTEVTAGSGHVEPGSVVVPDGDSASFQVIPATGWRIDAVTGCGGSLSGITYSTAPVTAACTVSASFVADPGGICRVTATASDGTGMDWATPMRLQAALGDAYCKEIWVAAGLYLPGADVDDSFVIRPAVQMFGGFAATESSRGQRDPSTQRSILSGDLDGDDGAINGIVANADDIVGSNSRHVVVLDGRGAALDAATRLDGFVITAGDAGGGDGGGLQCLGACQPTLAQLHFSGNRATRGGALYNAGVQASPAISASAFSGNRAQQGGAIYNDGQGGNASPVLSNLSFSANRADDEGGALYNDGRGGVSSPLLLNLTFTANQARRGGAIHGNAQNGVSQPDLGNVIVWGNPTDSGYELGNDQAQPYIANSIIQGAYVGPDRDWNNALGLDGGGNFDGDPGLLPLADNGGPSPTHMIQRWSLAVDRADAGTCPDTDQRGVPRPQDVGCDIGAVEHQRGDAGSMFWDGFE